MSIPTRPKTGSRCSSRSTRTAPRKLGINPRDVDNALYNAFGQRQVTTIYDELNQYSVIMGVAKQLRSSRPQALNDVYVPSRGTASAGGAATPANT